MLVMSEEEARAAFERWWGLCPLRMSKGQASRMFVQIVRRGQASVKDLEDGMARYAAYRAGKDARFTKHPATWLRGQCWLDELPAAI